ncbi:glycoside hydrolase family 1 protein [soil metagenome]
METNLTERLLQFPKEFPFGTAVASFQVENPDPTRYTDWDAFIHNNPRKNIIEPGEYGPDWWDAAKAKKDIDSMARIGTTSLRFSLEWARIEPQPGVFNPDALLAYRDLVIYMESKGIMPLITLNHLTLPEWIAQQGSWARQSIVQEFEKYVEYVLSFFPDNKYWITLNEPNGLIVSAYATKFFPPQKGSLLDTWRARNNMLEAHKRAHRLIKEKNKESQVGIAYALIWYRPENESDQLERWYTYLVDYVNATNWMVATMDHMDFIGCNYYTGYYLDLDPLKFRLTNRKDSAGIPKTMLLGQTKRPGAYTTDMGWPIVPDFFLSLLRNLYSSYHKPIIITENGIADIEDKYRAFYLLTHLVAMWKAMDEKIPILGYNYWSAIDNLEWLYGFTRHFGLIGYNAQTHERHLRHSVGLYRDIMEKKHIDISHLMKTYLPLDQQEKAGLLIQQILTAGKRTPRIKYEDTPENLSENQKDFIR